MTSSTTRSGGSDRMPSQPLPCRCAPRDRVAVRLEQAAVEATKSGSSSTMRTRRVARHRLAGRWRSRHSNALEHAAAFVDTDRLQREVEHAQEADAPGQTIDGADGDHDDRHRPGARRQAVMSGHAPYRGRRQIDDHHRCRSSGGAGDDWPETGPGTRMSSRCLRRSRSGSMSQPVRMFGDQDTRFVAVVAQYPNQESLWCRPGRHGDLHSCTSTARQRRVPPGAGIFNPASGPVGEHAVSAVDCERYTARRAPERAPLSPLRRVCVRAAYRTLCPRERRALPATPRGPGDGVNGRGRQTPGVCGAIQCLVR
jgi:hypothetical protein